MTHLLYDDDTIEFNEAKQEQLCYLRLRLVLDSRLLEKKKYLSSERCSTNTNTNKHLEVQGTEATNTLSRHAIGGKP